MAEWLDVGYDLAIMKHRHCAAQVRQVSDTTLTEIGVVHQEDIARTHGARGEVTHHRIGHGRLGESRQLAAVAVEQTDAIVVRLANHRPWRGPLDGVFDLRLDRI